MSRRGRDGSHRPEGAARPARTAGPGRTGPDQHGRPKQRPRQPLGQGTDLVQIWGFHAVREALRSARRKPVRLLATTAAAERLSAEMEARQLIPVILAPEDLAARLPRDAVHQGVLLEARPVPDITLDDLPGRGLVIVLDQLTDPHNVGAILRTAAAFGAEGLVTTARHAPNMTGVLAKAASGGLEHVPVVTVVNLARALEHLGDLGYQRIGLDSDGPASLETVATDAAVALVFGAEGQGLRRLTRENCDVMARLDMPGPIKSLNVSNACAAALTMLHLRRSQQAG